MKMVSLVFKTPAKDVCSSYDKVNKCCGDWMPCRIDDQKMYSCYTAMNESYRNKILFVKSKKTYQKLVDSDFEQFKKNGEVLVSFGSEDIFGESLLKGDYGYDPEHVKEISDIESKILEAKEYEK